MFNAVVGAGATSACVCVTGFGGMSGVAAAFPASAAADGTPATELVGFVSADLAVSVAATEGPPLLGTSGWVTEYS